MTRFSYQPVATSEQEAEEGAGNKMSEREAFMEQARVSSLDENQLVKRRMPYCIGVTLLLAILYVLSRTEDGIPQCNMQDFDIGTYRQQQLSASPPHIIECAQAGEGGSQEKCHLPRPLRYEALGQKGITLWMTGLSGSGKSTIAAALEEKLVLQYGKHVYRLDGDNIRTGLNRDLGFSDADRAESVRRVGELAALFSDSGCITLVGLVSPFRNDRDEVRKRHEEQGIKFMEVFMDVPLTVVQNRDPKGLYAKVEAGEIKGFTGVDAPYEPPLNPELDLKNYEMTIEESVNVLLRLLQKEGVLEGGQPPIKGLPSPDGGEIVDLIVPEEDLAAKKVEAETLAKVLLTDIDLNWLQTVGEGWAAPLKGFMREGTLLQTLHFNSILIDPANTTGNVGLNEVETSFSSFTEVPPRNRVSMSVPIVLPITDYTKDMIEFSGKKDVALSTKNGKTVAIIRNFEIYANRKEEIVTRCFGVIDRGHPYINHIYGGGDWLIGGEVELLGRITYGDGLDKYRLTQRELMDKFASMGADVIYAFQTRNPTHAGHAYLMKNGREQLLAKGYKNPVLWLSPLGGWTKSDDVPLDVRVKQHEAVIEAGELDKSWTVMAIWPSPMIYAGPTEVQFHAKSRRNGGASYFVVGRDPAGMKGSEIAEASPDDDLYDGDHGRYVLQLSPGMNGLGLLSFQKVKYDRTTQTMGLPDPSRPDDFISISGSTMRALARNGASWCEGAFTQAMVDNRECVPPGFMVPNGWAIVCDYYQNIDTKRWTPYSRVVPVPNVDMNTISQDQYGTDDYTLYVKDGSTTVSPWHDLQLYPDPNMKNIVNLVTEIPMFSTAKMEVQKSLPSNPIKQDINKDGSVRFYTYGTPFFNYGMLPKTWEDPNEAGPTGAGGDNDPLDVMEIGTGPLPMGGVVPCKILGALTLLDEGETDSKIICIRASDPLSGRIRDITDLDVEKPGTLDRLRQWLKRYKTSDGKPENSLASEAPASPEEAIALVEETHVRWEALFGDHSIGDADFWYSGSN